jgi:hypothetical protein
MRNILRNGSGRCLQAGSGISSRAQLRTVDEKTVLVLAVQKEMFHTETIERDGQMVNMSALYSEVSWLKY